MLTITYFSEYEEDDDGEEREDAANQERGTDPQRVNQIPYQGSREDLAESQPRV